MRVRVLVDGRVKAFKQIRQRTTEINVFIKNQDHWFEAVFGNRAMKMLFVWPGDIVRVKRSRQVVAHLQGSIGSHAPRRENQKHQKENKGAHRRSPVKGCQSVSGNTLLAHALTSFHRASPMRTLVQRGSA